jgi:hypothetical protein
MDNNALLEFNDTVNLSHLGINGNGVTVEGVAGLAGLSANLNMDRLSITDGTDTAEFGLSGIEFADGTTQTTAYTGGATYLGDRISIYSGYLYNEDTSLYVTNLTLDGASTVNARNITLQSTGGGSLTFSDGTTMTTKAYGLPVGGTTGQVLSKINSADFNVEWSTASGGGGVDVQTFSTAGTTTWTKPAGAKYVIGYMWGSGGGGGSGARNATTGIRSGGSGGAGGGLLKFTIEASLLSATESVVIGAGGVGGASVTVDNTNGNLASLGGNTSFGGKFTITSANRGNGGLTTGAPANTATSSVSMEGFLGANINNTGAAGSTSTGNTSTLGASSFFNSTGGGGGAGAAASSTTNRNGGNGCSKQSSIPFTGAPGLSADIAGGQAGNTSGTAPTIGTNGSLLYGGGTGGGAGAYRTATAGMAGANGGAWGAGGGGGSGSDNGFASGAGGNGGAGALVLITILG